MVSYRYWPVLLMALSGVRAQTSLATLVAGSDFKPWSWAWLMWVELRLFSGIGIGGALYHFGDGSGIQVWTIFKSKFEI